MVDALLRSKLNYLADELADIKRILPDDDSEGYSRNPRVLAQNVITAMAELKTRLAVGELVQVAFSQYGGDGETDVTVLRRRAA